MARLGLVFPYEDIAKMAQEVVEEYNVDVAYMNVIQTADAVKEARKAVEAGADIIIARGYQANLIKKYTNIPVAEMRIHTQEIGLLLKKAKNMIKKNRPCVGILVYENMLSDMTFIGELFDVEFLVKYMERLEDSLPKIQELIQEGVDLIIGGEKVCEDAHSLGYPGLIYTASYESIKEAIREAERMAFAMETEKLNEAQFETVLDTSSNGIIKINGDGNITVINKLIENMIGKNLEDVVGKTIYEVFPEFEEEKIISILSGETDYYTVSVNIRHQPWSFTVAPIQYDNRITGAIMSLQKIAERTSRRSGILREMYLEGYVAKTTFQNIHTASKEMKAQLELARKYALSESPVLLYGEEGTERRQIAEAIHNNSNRKNGPFVSVDLRTMESREQLLELFGKDILKVGDTDQDRLIAMAKANHGTLFLEGIEYLDAQGQSILARVMAPRDITRTDTQILSDYDVRIIATAKEDLSLFVKNRKFSEGLFYQLHGLVITVPPLRQRQQDLLKYFQFYFRESSKKYSKYLVLTQGALREVQEYSWNGNLIQILSFCERAVLEAEKRSVDEVFLRKIYESLYPTVDVWDGHERVVVYESKEAKELNELLQKYHGSRSKVASELGISTTTLWRWMKKYGIEG